MRTRSIKWTPEMEKTLKQAVEQHNKVIDDIGSAYTGSIGFEKVNYDDLRRNIVTKRGYNQKIGSLKRLTEDNATSIKKTASGYDISEYHLKEARLSESRYKTRLKDELKYYRTPIRQTKRSAKISMTERLYKQGVIDDTEYEKRLQDIKQEYKESASTKSRIRSPEAKLAKKNLETEFVNNLKEMSKDRSDFQDRYIRLINKGDSDFIMNKTIEYKKNYLSMIEARYSNFDNYETFYNAVKDMSPEEFYEFMQQDELTEDLTYQSEQHYAQQEFNKFLEDIGILGESTTVEIIEEVT